MIWRPDVVFANGGYVCLPVGIATKILKIPLVIHDADAVPGLTNRILAPIARHIMTGLPLSHYDYPSSKTKYVGIAIDPAYRIVSDEHRRKLKKSLGFDIARPLVVFAGGGLGSKQINDAVAVHLDELMKFTNVVLVSGAAQYDELRSLTPIDDKRFQLKDFVPGLREVFSAADVVVSRAGATTLLELAALAAPTIVVPSKRLKWQVEHANHFVAKKAVLLLDEDKFDEPKDTSLVDTVRHVVNDTKLRRTLGNNLHDMARPHAARDMARVIERVAHSE
jgi:UDP-N-acetylglucosamine--N-acetylmuramyl-(pentapeptide) pyrophosphoryl-undecaprenol N-acetylglucosamine transferase